MVDAWKPATRHPLHAYQNFMAIHRNFFGDTQVVHNSFLVIHMRYTNFFDVIHIFLALFCTRKPKICYPSGGWDINNWSPGTTFSSGMGHSIVASHSADAMFKTGHLGPRAHARTGVCGPTRFSCFCVQLFLIFPSQVSTFCTNALPPPTPARFLACLEDASKDWKGQFWPFRHFGHQHLALWHVGDHNLAILALWRRKFNKLNFPI